MSEQQRLIQLPSGQIIGQPITMREWKRLRRQRRLQRREVFRVAKQKAEAAMSERSIDHLGKLKMLPQSDSSDEYKRGRTD